MLIVGSAGLVAMGVSILIALRSLDSVITAEYELHFREWEKDGKPSLRSAGLHRSFATQRVSFIWFFRTPAWADQDAAVRHSLNRYRLYLVMANVAGLLLFVILLATIVNGRS